MEEFTQRVVMVTGACGGIGEAIARAFARAGAQLALCDLRRTEIERVSGEIREAGTTVHAAVVDVADEASVRSFCQSVGGAYGHVDVLVNTVGIIDNAGDVETLETAVWEKTLAVNLSSAFLMAKHCVPLLKSRGGIIVNISSVSGYANQANYMAYSVTKAGLISLTKSEAIDLAPHGIRAVAICPGSVSTPLMEQQLREAAARSETDPAAVRRSFESQYPSGRFSTPQEIAELTLFLCSGRVPNITGSAVVIDGGLTAVLPER